MNEQLKSEIGERVLAEGDLQKSNALFEGLFESAPDTIVVVDAERRIVRINTQAETMFGYSEAEILGASLNTLIPERFRFSHDARIHDFALSVIAARRRGERREIFARRKNGEEFPAEVSISIFEIGGEKIFTVVLRDITDQKLIESELREAHSHMEQRVHERTAELVRTNKTLQAEMTERKRAEKALRESEERFRLSIEDVKDYAIFTLDPDGLVVSWNAGAERIKGYTTDEIIGKDHSCFYPEEDILSGKPVQHLNQAIEEGRCQDEGWRMRKDGSRYWADAVLTALRNSDGKLLGYSNVMRDMTERKRAEDMVKASLNEKEILLKEIHHRVKNNLQVISSLLNLQSRYITDSHALATFKDSQNRVKSMALIHEQLYQSKNLAEVDFSKYVQTLASDLFVSYGTASRDIATKIDIKEIFLNIDTAIPCGLIINELVSNSLKYAFHSSVNGKVEVGLRPTDDDRFVLTVKDNGVGFPNDLDFRNTSSLGLRLVNSLTSQLKGNIELSANEGTEFKITFSALRYKERM